MSPFSVQCKLIMMTNSTLHKFVHVCNAKYILRASAVINLWSNNLCRNQLCRVFLCQSISLSWLMIDFRTDSSVSTCFNEKTNYIPAHDLKQALNCTHSTNRYSTGHHAIRQIQIDQKRDRMRFC